MLKTSNRAGLLLLLGAVLLGGVGCATTGSSNGQWSGDLARTYNADMQSVMDVARQAVSNTGMNTETRQQGKSTYVIEAVRESGSTLSGRRVQLTGMSVYVRDMGAAGINLQVSIPEQNTSYASRRNDSYARKQADRILTVLDKRFRDSDMVQ